MDLLRDLALIVVAALMGGLLARRAGQPVIVGYFLAGIVVGPFTGGVSVSRLGEIEQLAELGVALLLFSLGLEVSFRELAPVRLVAIAGGILQIALTIGLGMALALGFGWPWRTGVWFGALVALSSTVVALKTLHAQGRLGTLSSRVMLGLLVVQDLAVVPLMIVLPELTSAGVSAVHVLAVTARAFGLVAVIILAATKIVPPILRRVALRSSRELFLLATMAVALGIGYVAWRSGVSLALGAFVAGLVINESEYAHQALSDVTPLRDLFGTLFFVSVGMLLEPAFLWRHPGLVLGSIGAISAGKALIFALTVRLFGYRRIIPIAVGLTLFQVGEFAFVLARVGADAGALSSEAYGVLLTTAVATMGLTPAVSAASPWLYERVRGPRASESLAIRNVESGALQAHVIIAGGGRIGRSIGAFLRKRDVPCLIVELDLRRFERCRAMGLPVLYGDATHDVVLEAAGLPAAAALLITIPVLSDVRPLVESVRQQRPELPIVARAEAPEWIGDLYALGVSDVTSPELESAIEMTRQALKYLRYGDREADHAAAEIRRREYHLGAGRKG